MIDECIKNIEQFSRGEADLMMIRADVLCNLSGVRRLVKFFVIEGRAKSGERSIG